MFLPWRHQQITYAPVMHATLQALNASASTGSEIACAAWVLAPVFDMVLMDLAKYSNLLPIELDRNTTDPSSATVALQRPDLCIWYNSCALLFKGEEKSSKHGSTLQDAISDLSSKMSSNWSVLTMGSLPYLPCYASCGSSIQFQIIKRDSNMPTPISKMFDLQQVRCRVCLCCLYLALALQAVFAT